MLLVDGLIAVQFSGSTILLAHLADRERGLNFVEPPRQILAAYTISSPDFGAGLDVATSMILQPDGKLVAAGYCDIAETSSFCLARFGSVRE